MEPSLAGSIATAALTYVGGVLTKPLQDHLAALRKRRDIRLCLYSEVARLVSQYERMAYHSPFPIKVRCENEAYKFAMQSPEVYYSLKEKHFFDGLYRTFLNFDGRRKKPVEAKTMMAAIDEQIMLGNVDRKLLRKHCDENGRRHLDILPKRVFKSVEEFDQFIAA
jgi:hypothetical protein